MNAVTFESVYIGLTVFTSHVLYTHIMCDKMYHPKNNGVLVYESTYSTMHAVG